MSECSEYFLLVGPYCRTFRLDIPKPVRETPIMDEEIISELLDMGLTERHAETVEAWHRAVVAEARGDATADTAWRILEWLLSPLPKLWDVRSKAIGLAFAVSRPDFAGYETLDDAGRGEGVSHATVANWKNGALQAMKRTPPKESFK